MTVAKNHLKIQHDLLGKLFFIRVKSSNAELHYERHGNEYINFTSTSVPKEFRNIGIGAQLAQAALEFARTQHLKVKATCSFMSHFLENHPEYDTLRRQI